MEDKSKTVRN